MKQIISSYEHHFKQELTLSTSQEVPEVEELAERLLFERSKPKSKFNHSLAEKINKLKMKEKDREKEKIIKSEYEDSYIYDSKVGIKMNDSKAKYNTSAKQRSVSKKSVKGVVSSKKLKTHHN